MTAINTYILITLNINGFNSIKKRYRLAEWIKTQISFVFCLQETMIVLKAGFALEYSNQMGPGRKQASLSYYLTKSIANFMTVWNFQVVVEGSSQTIKFKSFLNFYP